MTINQKDLVHNYPWNTIYIMDAMRYDIFKEIIDEDHISGKLLKVWSTGCETEVWIRNMFTEPTYKDIVLIANNPTYWKPYTRYVPPKFSKAVPTYYAWKESGDDITPTDEILGIAERQIMVNKGKRLIIHDMPPHLPYCEETGKAFLDQLLKPGETRLYGMVRRYGRRHRDNWMELREYYKRSARETLHRILDCGWLRRRGGLVISADHGEMIGEHQEYNHSLQYRENFVLRFVPWFVPT